MACLHASRTASTDSGLAFIVATTVTGMGDRLLAEYVLDGCLAYLGGFSIRSAHVDPNRHAHRRCREDGEKHGVDGAQPRCFGPADPQLPGDQEERERH